MENTIILKTTDLLTVAQFARHVGHPRITIYRWAEKHKIGSIIIGTTIYIPKSELKLHSFEGFVIKKCSNCYHEKHEDSTRTCACRDISDMEDSCKDWVWRYDRQTEP